MKNIVYVFVVLFLFGCPASFAQATQSASSPKNDDSSWFFPKDYLRGYIDFGVAPPHNEPDLSRCLPANPCTAFARYVLSGYVEFQPFARGPLKHFYAFFQPTTYFGRNIPQVLYTASAQPLAMEHIIGVGFELPRDFELRLASHATTSFGKFANTLSPTDSGPDKPLGRYTTISVRWNFGGYGRRTHSW